MILVCSDCSCEYEARNLVLGKVIDDPALLEKLALYLRERTPRG